MKSEDEQMLQQIMDTDTMGYACIYDSSGKREEYLIALTAENLANLIGGKGGEVRQISVTDVLDRLVVDSRMETLGSCPAQRLCRKINQFLAPIQRGEKEAGGDSGRVQGRDGRILCCERESGHLDIPLFFLRFGRIP